MKLLLLLNFVTPAVMLIVAVFLRWREPPYPGPWGSKGWKCGSSGYNTPSSRRSQAHWDYAQTAAANRFLRNGCNALWMCAVCTLLGLIFLPWWTALTIGCTLGIAMMIEAFVQTEEDIRAHFGGS